MTNMNPPTPEIFPSHRGRAASHPLQQGTPFPNIPRQQSSLGPGGSPSSKGRSSRVAKSSDETASPEPSAWKPALEKRQPLPPLNSASKAGKPRKVGPKGLWQVICTALS